MKEVLEKFMGACQVVIHGVLSERFKSGLIRAGFGAIVMAGALAWEADNSPSHAQGLSCVVIGDSLAEGTLGAMRPCSGVARRGITSTNFLSRYGQQGWQADLVVVSLGANDFDGSTQVNLQLLRSRIESQRVVWIVPNLPNRPGVADAIRNVAMRYGDPTVSASGSEILSRDGLHPTGLGYQIVARRVVEAVRYQLAQHSMFTPPSR